jgi:hypothetical protein
MTLKFLAQAQRRSFAKEDEIHRQAENSEGIPNEYGLRILIPAPFTDSDEYWHHVATKWFALSTQLGPPTFFLTFTMNPYWADQQALKRDTGLFSDSAMTPIVLKTKLSAVIKFIQQLQILG